MEWQFCVPGSAPQKLTSKWGKHDRFSCCTCQLSTTVLFCSNASKHSRLSEIEKDAARHKAHEQLSPNVVQRFLQHFPMLTALTDNTVCLYLRTRHEVHRICPATRISGKSGRSHSLIGLSNMHVSGKPAQRRCWRVCCVGTMLCHDARHFHSSLS